jgi:hypothetical protein
MPKRTERGAIELLENISTELNLFIVAYIRRFVRQN